MAKEATPVPRKGKGPKGRAPKKEAQRPEMRFRDERGRPLGGVSDDRLAEIMKNPGRVLSRKKGLDVRSGPSNGPETGVSAKKRRKARLERTGRAKRPAEGHWGGWTLLTTTGPVPDAVVKRYRHLIRRPYGPIDEADLRAWLRHQALQALTEIGTVPVFVRPLRRVELKLDLLVASIQSAARTLGITGVSL
jgi:hypothetical protein